ncbi:MAG: prolyl oligopeptidase family serine peptidase [Planctomycetes bacterium]|nr:prolyl oligopeptidase family serine peptidase [Planctomycetota bacterium]
MKISAHWIGCVGVLAFVLPTTPHEREEAGNQVKTLRTPSGVRFGILGEKGSSPLGTLFVFASRLEHSLGNDDYIRVGRILAKQGYLCVSLDLPCHGEDAKPGEPGGLSGWRARLEQGDDVVPAFVAKAMAVLDYLIQEGYTDPQKVTACGTSRGGFIALHFAAADPRVQCVAAFAPVTDLLKLSEFTGMENHAATKSLALANRAEQLAGRAVWICIGNNDQRVSTDSCIAFTRRVVEASTAQGKPANVDLHVMTSVGHRIHGTAHEEAAAWILATVKSGKAEK